MLNANPPLLEVATGSRAGAGRRSDRMLAELLALNEDMVAQLRIEGLSAAGTTDFIATMIDQHEQVAKRLRAQLKSHESRAAHARSRDRGMGLGNQVTG
jgi:hypothetical protein